MAAKQIPPFWPLRPELWFLRVEGIMATHNVTEDAEKFNLVVGFLDLDTLDGVDDTVTNPPASDKYKTLKDAIIKLTGKTAEKKLQEAMSGMTLGDDKPSQLWRKLKSRASTHLDEKALKVRWMGLLPTSVSMMLNLVESEDMGKVAETADKLMEASRSDVMAVGPTRTPSPSRHTASLDQAQELANLKAAVSQLTSLVLQGCRCQMQQPPGSHQPRSRSRSHQRSRAASPAVQGWCWYHRKHGANAVRCTQPCTFQVSPGASALGNH